MEPSPRPGLRLAEGTLQADPDGLGGYLGSMSSSADSLPGATSLSRRLSPCAALCSSTWRSKAVTQDLVCVEGTQGGYWKVVAMSFSAGLSSSTDLML